MGATAPSAPGAAAYARPAVSRAAALPDLWRWLAFAGLAGLLVFLVYQGHRSIRYQFPDFEFFYKGGAWLYHHGGMDARIDRLPGGQVVQRGGIEWYLPFVPRAMTLIAWMPFTWAGTVWLGMNVVLMVATLWLLGRHLMDLPQRDWAATQLIPILLIAVYWTWEFRLNQINIQTLFLLTLAFVLWQRGRKAVAGFWLGLAVLLKLTPALFVLWLAAKRERRTVGVAVLTIVLAGPVSDVIVFGPSYTRDIYSGWFYQAVTLGSHRGLILNQREMDLRNQGLGAVLSRWLHPTSFVKHFDNDPRAPKSTRQDFINIASLPREVIVAIVFAVAGASVLGLLWLARRRAADSTPWQLRIEWALCLLAMLWLMPVMRRYHMIWVYPALALLLAAVRHTGLRDRWSWLALASVACVIAAQAGLTSKPLEAGGVTLLCVLILAVPLVVLHVRLGRRAAETRCDLFTQPAAAEGGGVPVQEFPAPGGQNTHPTPAHA